MKHLSRTFFATLILTTILGAGCAKENKTADYFSEKQKCAEYIPKITRELDKNEQELNQSTPSGMLIMNRLTKVCYSHAKNSCLSGTANILGSKKKATFYRRIEDLLTGRAILVEKEEFSFENTDELASYVEKFQQNTNAKMDMLGCVN